MANKSSYHKEDNTFRFQTFHERLAGVNIDVVRKLGKFSSTPQDNDTFFGEALVKWTDLNCTQHFSDFRREISNDVQSFSQLVYHQEGIVAALLKHLQVENSLALEPLLDLVVQLARDLQGDFYPKFKTFFGVIVKLLSNYHHDVEALEKSFTCLAYLFKFLWRHMLKDMQVIYKIFMPLLSSEYKQYINAFAAESFAFLMRKNKNRLEFFSYMFKELEENENHCQGVGKLLFEMFKGAQKQFHSSLDEVLPLLLSTLGDLALPHDHVLTTLSIMMRDMTVYTSTANTIQVLTGILNSIDTACQDYMTISDKCSNSTDLESHTNRFSQHLSGLLHLLEIWVSYKDGRLIGKPEPLIKAFNQMIDNSGIPFDCVALLLKIVSSLLLSPHCIVDPQHRNQLLQKIFKSSYPQEIIFDFTKLLFDLPLFERDLLKCLLDYCNKQAEDDVSKAPELLFLISELLLHKVPPQYGIEDIDSNNIYLLDFSTNGPRGRSSNFCSWIISELDKQMLLCCDGKHTGVMWCLLHSLPHLKPIDEKLIIDKLGLLWKNLNESNVHSEKVDNIVLGLLYETLKSLSLTIVDDKQILFSLISVESIVNLIRSHPSNAFVLRIADLYFSLSKLNSQSQALTTENFVLIFEKLQDNLSSPFGTVRLLTLHIFCQFELPMPLPPDDVMIDQPGVFSICLDVEQTAVHVTHFREKLRHLQKLDHGLVQNQLPLGEFHLVPLRYLLGQLYVNFSMLWPNALKLIETHAHGLSREQFWSIFGPKLSEAAALSEKNLYRDNEKTANELEVSKEDKIFHSYADKVCQLTDKADHVNFRHLLWQAMQLFPNVTEPKSKIVVPLLFQFLDNEYYPADIMAASHQNIAKKESEDVSILDETQQEVDDDDEEMQDGKGASSAKGNKKTRRRASNKTLITHLSLFAKFSNPRSLYMDKELQELYLKLLQHKDGNIQKVAFDCIMTYKFKYLTPYAENFEKLMDDKSFKKEIVLFSIDETTSTIQPEHRAKLIPILMRILYGKMYGKAGKDTAGKSHSQFRQNIVLRFLAGCAQEELNIFLDLVFAPFQPWLDNDGQIEALLSDVDMNNVIPLGKQQSVLTTIDVIFKKIGSLVTDYRSRLLKMLMCISAETTYLLKQRNHLAARHINPLKNLRQLSQIRIVQFFELYEDYKYSEREVSELFASVVWPQLEMLPQEGIYTPTPLLKLFYTWTSHSRFFVLLSKCDESLTPLPYLFQLLHAKSVNAGVLVMIMEIVENLLTVEEDEQGENVIIVDQTVPLTGIEGQTLTLGMKLLLPHISTILAYLKTVVEKMAAQAGKRKPPPARELRILSRLSEFVEDREQSQTVVSLLLPFLGRALQRSESVEVDILHAVENLIKLVPRPEMFITSIAKLFSTLSGRNSRTALCHVVTAIAQRYQDVAVTATLITKLNSWDPKRVEEPDYMLRLEAYQECVQVVQKSRVDTLNMDFLLLVLHNCLYMLATTDDMSLRDNSAHCMQEILKKVAEGGDDSAVFSTIVTHHLMPELKHRLKLKTEAGRHEFIVLLATLTRLFPKYSAVDDLVPLTDAEDAEADFFNNMIHIQMHRRARAMKKLAKHLSTHKMKTNTVVAFIIPMITAYLRDDHYFKHNSLQDGAIEALGAICRALPWDRYQLILKYYLAYLPKAVDHQKLVVRILVEVLNSFHFDLSNSRGVQAAHVASHKPLTENNPTEIIMDTSEAPAEPEKQTPDETAEVDATEMDINEVVDNTEVAAVEEEPSEVSVMALNTAQVCAEGLATRIHRVIVRAIIPQLHACLTQKVASDSQHKLAQAGKYAEDEEVLRVPLALAMVKLLQNLPKGTLNRNLPNVLMKVCQFLKSRAKDIRNSARDTLVKILRSLGASYFSYILKELRFSLKRGYQLHVLSYTVWMLLKDLSESDSLKPADLDHCISDLVSVFNEELFGAVSEEKDVEGILSKLFEARSSKSYDSYGLVAKYVGTSSLDNFIHPLKEKLDSTQSRKVSQKVSDVLKKISTGVVDNSGLDVQTLLTFVFGLTSKALPMFQKQIEKPKKQKPGAPPPSTYLIPAEPGRGYTKPKSNSKTNNNVLDEFALHVLNLMLKKGQLAGSKELHQKLLDPFVPVLTDSLESKHVKVTSNALRCLLWILKFPLPSLKQNIRSITNHLFVLLSNYASAGAAKGDNMELVIMCFKAMTVVVRDLTYHKIAPDQLQVLLGYVEADLHDHTRQATAFTLLKAILDRGRKSNLKVADIVEVMERIEKLSITSESHVVRQQCRQVNLYFLMNYPLGKKLEGHVEFYVRQLDYEYEMGRVSALEMIASMFESFPQKKLVEHSSLFFIPLASRLVNDDSSKCRKLSALAIKSLLEKLGSDKRDELFSICVEWLQTSKALIRKLGANALGLMVEVEAAEFEKHLGTVLPILENQLNPDKYSNNDIDVKEEKELDQLLFSLLTFLIKILRVCDITRKAQWTSKLIGIWESVEQHLLHAHTWVRLASAQLFGLLFAAWTPEQVVERTQSSDEQPKKKKRKSVENASSKEYLGNNTMETLHTLCGVFLKQLQSPTLDTELGDQVVKNVVYLAKVLYRLPSEESVIGENDDDEDADVDQKSSDKKTPSLQWLVKKMVREAKFESAQNVKVTIKRSSVLKWVAAVALDVGADGLMPYLPLVLPFIMREATNNMPNADEALITLAGEVLELIKTTVGLEVFSREYATAHKDTSDKRSERKMQKAQQMVTNPEMAARKKIKKNLLKKEARKRRMEEQRPSKKVKRKKMV